MTDTSNPTDRTETNQDPAGPVDPPVHKNPQFLRVAAARVRVSGRVGKAAALIVAAAVIGAAYVAGGPPAAGGSGASFERAAAGALPGATAGPAFAAPADLANGGTQGSLSGAGVPATTKDQSGTSGENQVVAAADATQIVKTGQMTLEVTDINGAVKKAQTTITGLGGYVDSSNLSGIGESATATITYRFPVARWDDALSALAKIGTKVLSEQTGSTDVTSQVIDLNARIDNLKTTETALQGIMARASAIPDVIAVENQLSDTQGQIEELTAERDHLNNQAAMSTLTATFQLPAQTVTTQATQDWTLGNQVDEAGAALVRIGQGLATMVVWVAVVVLPLGLAALLLFVIARLTRRILDRAGRRDAAAGA